MHEVMAKGILSAKNGMNLYRGCTHGCIYCDARSKCYQMNHAFEDIEVKVNAPELLEKALRSKRKKCMIGTGAMSDPYIHLEEKCNLTGKCLELIHDYDFGLAIQTKSSRILRDLEQLRKINNKTKCVVQMTVTTYDEETCKIVEPNVSTTKERFEVLEIMGDNGIPTVVWLDPILPFINDTEENLRGILDYCIKAKIKGVVCFSLGLTLREGNREYFYGKLDQSFPGVKEKYIKKYGNAYELPCDNNQYLMKVLRNECEKHGIMHHTGQVFSYMSKMEEKTRQISLLDLMGESFI